MNKKYLPKSTTIVGILVYIASTIIACTKMGLVPGLKLVGACLVATAMMWGLGHLLHILFTLAERYDAWLKE